MINITTIRKRMTKGFLLMMLFLAQSVVSSAQVKLYMENFTLSSGEKKQVSLLLDNDKTATQMQVEITLPNGMSYVDESAAKTTRVKGRGATVQASTVTGKLVIVETGGTVEAGSGEVITFEVEDKNLKVGDHKITLSNIIISDANGDQLNQEETNTVTVKKLGLGDCLFAGPENLNVVVGKEYQVDITLTNEGINNLSALQGKLTLPAGLEIVPGEEGKFIYSDRTPSPLEFTFKENEGSTSFVLSSSANQTIDGQSGVVFSFKVKASASLAENTSILLSDLRVAATSGLSADVPNVKINVVNTSVADKAAFATYQIQVGLVKDGQVTWYEKDGQPKYLATTYTVCNANISGEEISEVLCAIDGFKYAEDYVPQGFREVALRVYASINNSMKAEVTGTGILSENYVTFKHMAAYNAIKSPGFIYIVGNCTDWQTPNAGNADFYSSWRLFEKDDAIGSKVYYGTFDLPAGDLQFRNLYEGAIMTNKAKGTWLFSSFGGGKVEMTVDLNQNKVKFEIK